MILAIEKVRFLQGVGDVTLSGDKLVGGSVDMALLDTNGCMVSIWKEKLYVVKN